MMKKKIKFGRSTDKSIEDKAWHRGYNWAIKHGYNDPRSFTVEESTRNCRLIAMAYATGYVNGRKFKRNK